MLITHPMDVLFTLDSSFAWSALKCLPALFSVLLAVWDFYQQNKTCWTFEIVTAMCFIITEVSADTMSKCRLIFGIEISSCHDVTLIKTPLQRPGPYKTHIGYEIFYPALRIIFLQRLLIQAPTLDVRLSRSSYMWQLWHLWHVTRFLFRSLPGRSWQHYKCPDDSQSLSISWAKISHQSGFRNHGQQNLIYTTFYGDTDI